MTAMAPGRRGAAYREGLGTSLKSTAIDLWTLSDRHMATPPLHPQNPMTLVMIPCFAGAAWNLAQMRDLQNWPMRTFRLPDKLDDLEKLSDFVVEQVKDLES
jgi:hypothetical protein